MTDRAEKVFFIRLAAMMLALQQGPIIGGSIETTTEARADRLAKILANYLGVAPERVDTVPRADYLAGATRESR
jgi:hypothetical protein